MDYEYADDDHYGGRILWGRIAVLATALVLAFVAGSCTARGGPTESELTAARAERDQLQAQVDDLEAELAAKEAGGVRPADTAGDTGGDTGGDDGGDSDSTDDGQDGDDGEAETEADPTPETLTHSVEAHETLFGIAEQYYGDGAKFPLIAEANNINRDTPLRVNQQLTIPPLP